MSHGKTLAFTPAETEDSCRDGGRDLTGLWGWVSWATRWGMDRVWLWGWETSTKAAAKFRPETLAPGPGW